jgi:hypothetical protein
MSTPPNNTGRPLRSVPRGVMHVPVTPFKDDLSVDYATFEKLVDWHVRQKPSSLCVILHIAESVSLTKDEHKKLIELSVKVAAGRVPVIANVSMAGTDQAIDLARHSEKVGADAVICLSPYYWPVPEEALFEHFLRVARATPLPFTSSRRGARPRRCGRSSGCCWAWSTSFPPSPWAASARCRSPAAWRRG